jgi:hypothetical protein
LDLQHETALRKELEKLADTGVTIRELDAKLRRCHLSREEYDELWLYAWTLLERRASRMVIAQNEDWYGYSAVEGG